MPRRFYIRESTQHTICAQMKTTSVPFFEALSIGPYSFWSAVGASTTRNVHPEAGASSLARSHSRLETYLPLLDLRWIFDRLVLVAPFLKSLNARTPQLLERAADASMAAANASFRGFTILCTAESAGTMSVHRTPAPRVYEPHGRLPTNQAYSLDSLTCPTHP